MAGSEERDGSGSVGPLDGLWAFAGGIGFVLTTPAVWGWALVPVGVLALLAAGLCGLSWWGAWEAGKALAGEGTLGTWTLTVLFGLVGAMLAVLVALALAQPCSGRRPCHVRQRGGRYPSWPVATTRIATCL